MLMDYNGVKQGDNLSPTFINLFINNNIFIHTK